MAVTGSLLIDILQADFRQPDWKSAFYGENYKSLSQIKAKYDPHSVFYALTAVGSDE